jgi:uncharacterized membrane protein YeaQ/YmgE (transglycosylase-associated protein family)
MGFIWTIVIGLIVGAVARLLTPGKDPAGFIMTALVGIGGAVLATYLGQFLGLYQAGQGAGFIASVLGAIVLLLVVRRFRKS